jgi:hypothetical protein
VSKRSAPAPAAANLPCYVGDGHPLLERLTAPIPELAGVVELPARVEVT